ncbi:hypothetical protein F4823DRAFT_567071 [Ustulina deusta]|nr:hypothetical protein F4823DRAFT_567071 [Ustulina deusta]
MNLNQQSRPGFVGTSSIGGFHTNTSTFVCKPWKYVGYRGYTKFIASKDDFIILRHFNSLNIRIALLLQDEIAVLENELAEIDEKTNSSCSKHRRRSSRRRVSNIFDLYVTGIITDYGAILPEECKYLEHDGDLFSVIQKDKAPLRRLIDSSRRLPTLSIWRQESSGATNDEGDWVS